MKVNKILLTGIITCALLSVGFVGNELIKFSNQSPIISSLNNGNGIRVKKSNSGIDTNGYDYITFSYSLEPSNTLDKDVIVSANYKDGSSCSDVLDISLNKNSQLITVTCLKNFTQQIVLTVTCQKNTNATASVTVDYKEKIKSVTVDSSRIEEKYGVKTGTDGYNDYSNAWTTMRNDENPYNTRFDLSKYINIELLKGSIDPLDVSEYSIRGVITTSYAENTLGSLRDMQGLLTDDPELESFNNGIRNVIWEHICSGGTELFNIIDEIYDCTNGDENLINQLNEAAQATDFERGFDSFTVSDVEIVFTNIDKVFNVGDLNIYYSLSGMTIPSDYYVSTNSISLEEESIVF